MSRTFNHIQVDPTRPHESWEAISTSQIWRREMPLSLPQALRKLRVVCISDTHNLHEDIQVPLGDILIHAGDFTGTGTYRQVSRFLSWFISQPHTHKILVAGNHDLTLDADHYDRSWFVFHRRGKLDDVAIRGLIDEAQPHLHYLEDSSVSIEGVHIYGSPWQPEFYAWGFNLPRGEACAQAWRRIPSDTDLLITHGPPLGHGDVLVPAQTHCGCVDLLAEIQQRVKPAYHIFGHIHEGYGVTSDGVTTFINASSCDVNYQPIQPPIVFDIPHTRQG